MGETTNKLNTLQIVNAEHLAYEINIWWLRGTDLISPATVSERFVLNSHSMHTGNLSLKKRS